MSGTFAMGHYRGPLRGYGDRSGFGFMGLGCGVESLIGMPSSRIVQRKILASFWVQYGKRRYELTGPDHHKHCLLGGLGSRFRFRFRATFFFCCVCVCVFLFFAWGRASGPCSLRLGFVDSCVYQTNLL